MASPSITASVYGLSLDNPLNSRFFSCVVRYASILFLRIVNFATGPKGRLYTESERRLIYLGSGFVAGEPVEPYGSGPKSDQVGYAFLAGPKSWRIEFPAPYYESKLDILEFRR